MEQTEVKDWKKAMTRIKKKLEWGDQRRIADRLNLGHGGLNKVSLALKGFIDDEDFLTKLEAAAQKILEARKNNPL